MIVNSNKKANSRSARIGQYFSLLNDEVKHSYSIAEAARRKGTDPKPHVEIPLATTMAERVEGLVGPKGVAKEIEKLAAQGHTSIAIALKITDQIVHEKYGSSSLPEKLAEQAIRTGVAIITNGVVSAPLEGIASVSLGVDDHLVISFASPIRGAGGTAQAMSVVLAELVRESLHLPRFRSTKKHLERCVEEILLYSRIKNLQYPVSEDGIKIAVRSLSVEIAGEPTEKQEVTANREVPGISSDRVRGGMCLVLNDGIVGRWNKTLKTVDDLGLGGWDWLRDISRATKDTDEEKSAEVNRKNQVTEKEQYVDPEYKYVSDVIGGRPILSHPSRKGGFRLRYGRGRNTGLAGVGVNPATMTILQFLAPGTHIVTERPGKGSIVTPISTIEGPLILLQDGSAVRVNSVEKAEQILAKDKITEILELGDILVSFGEFVENNKELVPSGYVEEWWAQELSSAVDVQRSALQEGKKESIPSTERLQHLVSSPLTVHPSAEEALAISESWGIPMHPRYTPNWHDISNDEFWKLRDLIKKQLESDNQATAGILPFDEEIKKYLENLAIPHKVDNNRIFLEDFWQSIFFGLLLDHKQISRQEINWGEPDQPGRIRFRLKAPIRVGARLGRPEKAKERRMKPPVHVLYPIRNYGGPTRNLLKVHRQSLSSIEIEIQHRQCKKSSCKKVSHGRICSHCGSETQIYYICTGFEHHESTEETCETCSAPSRLYSNQKVNFMREFGIAEKQVGKAPKLVKGVKLLMSEARTPEPLEKGILRARYNVFTFKDGTCRFDMTDAPLTHFRPHEMGVSVAKLRKLGYQNDIDGEELTSKNQIVEILPQDIIVNQKALDYLFRVSKFVDAELDLIYGLEPFYGAKSRKDMIGCLVMGLAPHTSAGVIGRIIGSTPAEVCYSHPFWHAAKRRNCLAATEEIPIWDTEREELLMKSIGEVVEEATQLGATQEVVDDFGTLAIDNPWPPWRTISIDPTSRSPILQPIKHWIKGTSDEWVEIRTKKGRTVRMTAGHQALVWNPQTDTLVKRRASELKEGDYIPVLTDFKLPTVSPPARVNILKELAERLPSSEKFETFKQQVRLRKAKKWIRKKFTSFAQQLSPSDEILTPKKVTRRIRLYFAEKMPSHPYKKPFDWDWHNSIPLNHLQVLHQEGIFTWEEIPETARLGMARDDHTLSPYIPFTTDLLRLLGYLVAEGYIRDEGTCYQTNFSLPNRELREHVQQLIEDVLGAAPYYKKDNDQLVHTGRIHAYLIAYAWGVGTQALNKRLPSFVYTLPREYRLNFISALIDGDGSIIPKACRTTIYTGNSKLSNDYCLILSTIGVFARVHKGKGDRYGEKVLKRYKELGIDPKKGTALYHVNIPGKENESLINKLNLKVEKKKNALTEIEAFIPQNKIDFKKISDRILVDRIKNVQILSDCHSSYCLEVNSADIGYPAYHNITLATAMVTSQCDGDEDSIILLLDGLLNFSRSFLPATRGGLMDAPLVLSSHLEPKEVDPEAHNIDTSWSFPLAFFQATWHRPSLPANEVPLVLQAKDRLGTPLQYEGFGFTHDTEDIAAGPQTTLYKRLKTMADKVREQMSLASKIRAVDADDVAKRVLDSHFFRDMAGNLRAYGTQTTRCIKCNRKYRRIPLSGQCRCGGRLILTVFPEGTKKYLAITKELERQFDIPEFAQNRIQLLELIQDQLFSGDQKQQRLDDFIGE
ncbi:MAG: DNA polymerase II large subunit [Candidatus Heimdallarchaeota archaeon]